MSGMKDLFGDEPYESAVGKVRTSDPDTSFKAARRISISASSDRNLVLQTHLQHRGGLTDYELAYILDRQQNSVGKRRTELRDAELIEDSKERRPAPSGSSAIVWRITHKGIALAQGLLAISKP